MGPGTPPPAHLRQVPRGRPAGTLDLGIAAVAVLLILLTIRNSQQSGQCRTQRGIPMPKKVGKVRNDYSYPSTFLVQVGMVYMAPIRTALGDYLTIHHKP